MGRWLACFVLASAFISSSALAEPFRERDAVQSICRAGLAHAVAKARRAQGEAAVVASRVLPNPSLVVEHQRSLSGVSEHETVAGVSLPLGIAGRRWLLQDAAQARRQQASHEARAGLFEAALSFREAYVAAAVAQARVAVLTGNQGDLDRLTIALQELAKGGEAAGYDQLRQATAARVHRQGLELARAAASSSRIALQAWLDREVLLPSDALATLAAGRGGRSERPSDAPEVQGLEAGARAAELEARAARRRAVPDLSLFAGYRNVAAGGETGHGIALGFEAPITLFDRGQGDAQRSKSDAQLARALAQRLRKRLDAAARAAKTSLELLEARVPEVQATSRDALTVRDKAGLLYAADEANITELLEAYRAAEEAQLAELAFNELLALTRLQLMQASGSMFDAELDRDCRVVTP